MPYCLWEQFSAHTFIAVELRFTFDYLEHMISRVGFIRFEKVIIIEDNANSILEH